MALFKTVNENFESKTLDVKISNIDVSSNHWGTAKKIFGYMDAVEYLLPKRDSFEKALMMHAMQIMKDNRRILECKFYRAPENRLIMLITSEMPNFKDVPTFNREITGVYKDYKFTFSIVEITPPEAKEVEAGTKTIPESWKFDEEFTKKYNKLNMIFG